MRIGVATALNLFSLASLQLICQLGNALFTSVTQRWCQPAHESSQVQLGYKCMQGLPLPVVQVNQCIANVKGHLNDNLISSNTAITASILKQQQPLTAALRSGQATSGISSCSYLTPHLLSQGSKPFSQSYFHHGFIPPSRCPQLCHNSSLLTLMIQNQWQ